MQNPCYNKATKTDCPKRSVGCGENCPEWKKYVESRDKAYIERALVANANRTLTDGHLQRIKKSLKNKRK